MVTKKLESVDRHVGSRVRMRRLMVGMSQGALADQIGITFQQIQKYEKGMNRVSASRLQQIAAILNVPVPFFFEGASESREAKRRDSAGLSIGYINDFVSSRDGLALIRAFVGIKDPAIRRSIVRMVEMLAGPEPS
jgi:transcriptional regulator with XRE-family HTH domain